MREQRRTAKRCGDARDYCPRSFSCPRLEHLADELLLGLRQAAEPFQLSLQLRCRLAYGPRRTRMASRSMMTSAPANSVSGTSARSRSSASWVSSMVVGHTRNRMMPEWDPIGNVRWSAKSSSKVIITACVAVPTQRFLHLAALRAPHQRYGRSSSTDDAREARVQVRGGRFDPAER